MIEAGIHPNYLPRDYHSWRPDPSAPGNTLLSGPVSASMLKDFAPNPALWRNGWTKKSTKAMRTGSLVDTLLLTPNDFTTHLAVRPAEFSSYRTKEAQDWLADVTSAGKLPITRQELSLAQLCVQSIVSNEDAQPFLRCQGWAQVALRNDFGETAVKGLLDWVPTDGPHTDCIVDLKTVDCEPDQFSLATILHSIDKFAYHISGGWYLQLWNSLSDQKRSRFVCVFVCQKPPFPLAVVELARGDLESGMEICLAALTRFVECCKTDTWLAPFAGKINLVERPVYALERDFELIEGLKQWNR